MVKKTLLFILKLVVFTLILLIVHYTVFYIFFPNAALFYPIWIIYVFNVFLVIEVYFGIHYKVSRGSQKTLPFFLALMGLKMVLALIFLLPLFLGKSPSPVMETINFFIPYFCCLGFEIFALDKLFKDQETN